MKKAVIGYIITTVALCAVAAGMQKRRLTHRQKAFLASCGLKPENWYLEKRN